VWWIKEDLDLKRMSHAASMLVGRHDFVCFRAADASRADESTIVVVEKSELLDWEHEIHYRVTASHFLWKMVKRLVGMLVEVGRGNLDASDVERLLKERSKEPATWTAPPSGLFLEKVNYSS